MAELRNLDVKIGFLDDASRPDCRHDRVFRDQFSRPFDQQVEQIECARADRYVCGDTRSIETKQTAAPPIEAEASELENVGRIEPWHALAFPAIWQDPVGLKFSA